MAAPFLTQICIALFVLFVIYLIKGKHLFTHSALLTLFFAVYFADNTLIILSSRFTSLQLVPNHVWEGFLVCGWSGKLYSTLFASALLLLCRRLITREELGVAFRQNKGSLIPACLVIFALATWAGLVGIASPKGKPDLQTLLYLAIMPGLNEELIYRGYLLAILDRIMLARFKLLAAPAGWGVIITSLMFGLLHGFWLDQNLVVHLEAIALRNAAFSGLIFAWLRERTGSLLMPVIAHGVEDVLFFLPRMF